MSGGKLPSQFTVSIFVLIGFQRFRGDQHNASGENKSIGAEIRRSQGIKIILLIKCEFFNNAHLKIAGVLPVHVTENWKTRCFSLVTDLALFDFFKCS